MAILPVQRHYHLEERTDEDLHSHINQTPFSNKLILDNDEEAIALSQQQQKFHRSTLSTQHSTV